MVSLVVEHDEILQILECLKWASAQVAAIEHVERITLVGAWGDGKEALDRCLGVDIHARCFDVICSKVGVFLASEQVPVGDGDHA